MVIRLIFYSNNKDELRIMSNNLSRLGRLLPAFLEPQSIESGITHFITL
jgi:hypothetical protein